MLRPYSYYYNNANADSQNYWFALAQQICALNITSDYLMSNGLVPTIIQIGVKLNLTQSEITDVLNFIQSLNISQAEISRMLSPCQNGQLPMSMPSISFN